MADFRSSIKGIWMKGMEAVGNAASSIASSTKSKVDEMNLVNRRTEILKDFGNRAYALWLKGEQFPEELASQLQELAKLDDQLNDLRAERLAGVKPETKQEEALNSDTDAADTGDRDEQDKFAEDEFSREEDGDLQSDSDREDPVPVIRIERPDEEKPAGGLSDAINDLFENNNPSDSTADQVNSALDSLEDGLKQFSEDTTRTAEDQADQLKDFSDPDHI